MTRLLPILAWCGCSAAPIIASQPRDVVITPLVEGVRRTEVRTNDRHEVLEANGLVLSTSRGPVLVESGWRDDQARELIRFVEVTFGRPPALVVVTHSHGDRSGGLAEVRARKLPVAMLERTARLLHDVRDGDLRFSEAAQFGEVELFFPGAGHASDNIVVWHSPSRTLYGGCFLKAAAHGIGWLGDADLEAWPSSLERVRARYGEARIVVPGHGAPGGRELINHTAALAAKAAPRR